MKKRKKRAKKGELQTITKAVTHIGLEATNPGKLVALDRLCEVFLPLTQQYVTLFCTEELPNSFRAPCFLTLLSERRQEINRAVNRCFEEHEGAQFAYEQLSVASMRHKARAMNAYMRASNLGHIPRQIEWNATKRGVRATKVKSAYSSQECHVCHSVDRKNRPNQQTFCCRVCDHTVHADENASQNIASRLGDQELRACTKRDDIKALLLKRHEQWKQNASLVVVQAPVQLGLWASSEVSTDVG